MKRNQTYAIDHFTKTVVVTPGFLKRASQFGDEYDLLQRFEAEGLSVRIKHRVRRKKESSKPVLLSYREMQTYISMLDDASEMLTLFETLKESAKARPDRLSHVNQWFRKEFPQYDGIPEFDDEGKIVHNPNPCISALNQAA